MVMNDHKTMLHFLRGMGPLLEVKDIMSTGVVTITEEKTVAQAAEEMKENNVSCIIVTDDKKKAKGIITERDLLYKVVVQGKDPKRINVKEVMTSPVLTISERTTVLAAGRYMSKKMIRRLLVTEKNMMKGIITQTDVAHVISGLGIWKDVKDVMSKEVVTISPQKTAAEAAELMKNKHISSLIVTKNKKPIGVLTEKDFLKKIVPQKKDATKMKVQEAMTHPIITIKSDYSIFNACRMMERYKIRRLVIIKNQKLLGIITRQDVFEAFDEKVAMFEDEYFQSLNKVPYGFFITDERMHIDYVNEPFMDIFGIEKNQDIYGKPLLPAKFWKQARERAEFIKTLQKRHILKYRNIELRDNKKKVMYADIYCISLTDVWGKTTGYQGIVVSKTEIKIAEQEREEYASQLEKQKEDLESLNDKLKEQTEILQHFKEATSDQLIEMQRIEQENKKLMKVLEKHGLTKYIKLKSV